MSSAGNVTCAQADWVLNQADSNFNFASIKKNNVYEVHTFNNYSGMISGKGEAFLELNLNSVNTGIEIRDERMKNMLFNTVEFPAAKYSLSLNPETLENLKAGERISMDVEGRLSLFGIEKPQTASLNVFKLSGNRVLVSTAKPIALKAADFGLDKGVEALREIAKLPVISQTVPVNFSLVFDQK